MSTRRWRFLFNIGVSALLIALVCRNIDLPTISERFSGQGPAWLLAAALIISVQIALATLRWDQIIRGLGGGLPLGTVFAASYMGAFFNSWLLGNVGGDIARATLTPAGNAGRFTIVQSVLFDRLASLAGLGLIIIPTLVLDRGPLARGLPLLASLAAVVLPFIALPAIPWLARALKARGAIAVRVAEVADNWRTLCRAPRWFGGALAAAAAGQLALVAVAYCFARAQHLDVSYLDFVILMPPVVLLAALPISAGGWGVRESAMVMALAPIDVAPASAVLISVQVALFAALSTLPGGILWLCRHGLRGRPLLVAKAQR
jgi:uncharacterized membrane protein YbhN (UPF0104 family)